MLDGALAAVFFGTGSVARASGTAVLVWPEHSFFSAMPDWSIQAPFGIKVIVRVEKALQVTGSPVLQMDAGAIKGRFYVAQASCL